MRSFSSSRAWGSSQGPTRGPLWSLRLPTGSSALGITWACMSTSIGPSSVRTDAHVHGVAVAQRLDCGFGVGKVELAGVQLLQWEPARLDDPDRLDVGIGVDAKRPLHSQTL